MYCNRGGWPWRKLYCNTVLWATGLYCNTNCIVSLGRPVSRYNTGWALGWVRSRRWGSRACTGRWSAARARSSRRRHWRGALDAQGVQQAGREWRRGRRTRSSADEQAQGAGWALLCAPRRASWASWVLVHPAWFFDLVFDSVFFLSH